MNLTNDPCQIFIKHPIGLVIVLANSPITLVPTNTASLTRSVTLIIRAPPLVPLRECLLVCILTVPDYRDFNIGLTPFAHRDLQRRVTHSNGHQWRRISPYQSATILIELRYRKMYIRILVIGIRHAL